ncbi:mechanosensitive ion channel family protein [Sphingomonas sp. ASV193]|uniref:mechanosensitive ion channel family protein n=1 Tax=Sphingomonas sp. ASV193 TaxID=3144405 RepID=UPI0032E8B7C9
MNDALPLATGRHVTTTIDWIAANTHSLAIGLLVAAGIVGLMLIVRAFGRWLLGGDPACARWRGVIGAVLSRTHVWFMVAAAIDIVASYADPPPKVAHLADILFTIAFAIQGALWARELVLGAIGRRIGDEPGETTLGNASAIIRVLVSVALFALATVVILDNLGVNVTALVAGLGVGGIAIGLAAQGIFADLFAALAIVFDRPFRRGDTIRFGNAPPITGTVERIGLKTTRVRAISGEQVVIGNTKLLSQELSNIAEAKVRRVTIPFSLVLTTPPDALRRLDALAAEVVKPQSACRLVRCVVTGIGTSSIDGELTYDHRASDADTLARAKAAIVIGWIETLAREGLKLAIPAQVSLPAEPPAEA